MAAAVFALATLEEDAIMGGIWYTANEGVMAHRKPDMTFESVLGYIHRGCRRNRGTGLAANVVKTSRLISFYLYAEGDGTGWNLAALEEVRASNCLNLRREPNAPFPKAAASALEGRHWRFFVHNLRGGVLSTRIGSVPKCITSWKLSRVNPACDDSLTHLEWSIDILQILPTPMGSAKRRGEDG